MSVHHGQHEHVHGPSCGHKAIKHGDHVDYVHDGHLHRASGADVHECRIEIDAKNKDACTPAHTCGGHAKGHAHGPGCGHEEVPHGDHVDYLVDGHLHHAHAGHCDDHGPLTSA